MRKSLQIPHNGHQVSSLMSRMMRPRPRGPWWPPWPSAARAVFSPRPGAPTWDGWQLTREPNGPTQMGQIPCGNNSNLRKHEGKRTWKNEPDFYVWNWKKKGCYIYIVRCDIKEWNHVILSCTRCFSRCRESIENDTKSQSVAIKLQLSKLNHSERERERD